MCSVSSTWAPAERLRTAAFRRCSLDMPCTLPEGDVASKALVPTPPFAAVCPFTGAGRVPVESTVGHVGSAYIQVPHI